MTGIFQLMDMVMAEELGVDLNVYMDVIDEFNDEDMTFIIETILSESSTQEDKQKAKDLFNTKVK